MSLFPILIKHILLGEILLWLMLCPLGALAQKPVPIDTVKLYMYDDFKEFTPAVAHNPVTLSKYLVSNCKSDACKVQVITNWIATNIKFDYNAYKKRLAPKKNLTIVLQKKKALSVEYAELFKEMCLAVDVAAAVVMGYTQKFDFYETDTLYRAEHAWSAVRLNGEWRLLDLTYGSGHVEPLKQNFQKFMAKNFGLKFVPKYKYVHEYDANWFYVAPDEMIFTHYPNLKMFQLLETPVSIESYIQGTWAIHGHLSWYYKVLKESQDIDRFVAKNQIDQWIYEAEEGYKSNRHNHNIKGYCYYLAMDSLFRANYISENQSWKASQEELFQLDNYLSVADSMLRLSLLDNTKEFQQKREQSKSWQLYTLSKNAAYILKFKLRKKRNLRQSKLIDRIYAINHAYQQKALKKANSHSSKTILKTNRLENSSLSDYTSCLSTLKEIDSLRGTSLTTILKKDTLLKWYAGNLKGEGVCEKEALVLKIHKGNNKALKMHLQRKKEDLPLAYSNFKLLDKKWLTNSQWRADSLNQVETDSFLVKLYSDQGKAEQLANEYYLSMEKQLLLLQKLKETSPQDFREDGRYLNAILDLEVEMKNYQQELKNCLGFQQKLAHSLIKGIHYMTGSERTLESDNRLESFRHREYMSYRGFIKNAENQKIQLVLEKVSELKSYINTIKQG